MSSVQGFPEATQPGQKPIVNSIFDFSDSALGQLRLWLEQNPPAVPITSVLGFSQFTVQFAGVKTSETTTSSTYTDLSTVGPQITGLSNGLYLLLYGAVMADSSLSTYYSPSVNSATPSDTDALILAPTSILLGGVWGKTATLSGGNNTVKMQYKSTGGNTGQFQSRWLVALRYANS